MKFGVSREEKVQKAIERMVNNDYDNVDEKTIKKAIEESIQEGDEVTLPGMGVFFEIIWQESTDNEKNKILTTLKNRFKKKAN